MVARLMDMQISGHSPKGRKACGTANRRAAAAGNDASFAVTAITCSGELGRIGKCEDEWRMLHPVSGTMAVAIPIQAAGGRSCDRIRPANAGQVEFRFSHTVSAGPSMWERPASAISLVRRCFR